MFSINFPKNSLYISIFLIWLTACAPFFVDTQKTPAISLSTTATPFTKSVIYTPSPIQMATPVPTSTPDMWKTRSCDKVTSVVDKHTMIWTYKGDMEGYGQIDALLNFTKENEIRGFLFDFKRMREYSVYGCVEGRNLLMWLKQGDVIQAVIQGEFSETDPRGYYLPDKKLSFPIISGFIIEKGSVGLSEIYLRLESGDGGTMEHRFQVEGVKDDAVILNTVNRLLIAVTNDDRTQVAELIHFPVQVFLGDERKIIHAPEAFLSNYTTIFGGGFSERLAITFPNYILSQSGNFGGTYLLVYGGGTIRIDASGKITEINNFESPTPTPVVTPIHNP